MFTPFSMGAKSCIGEKLSLLEIKSITTNFLMNYDFEMTVRPEEIEWVSRVIVEPKEKIAFKVWPRDLLQES